MSSSVGAKTNVASASSSSTRSSAAVTRAASSSVTRPTRPSIATWARDAVRSSWASRRSNDRLSVNANISAAGPSPNRLCQRWRAAEPPDEAAPSSAIRRPTQLETTQLGTTLLAGPRLDRQTPEPHEAGGVLVAERVARVVRGKVVAVQAVVGAATGDEATTGLEAEPNVAGHVALGIGHERVERLLQRREPQPVVHQLRITGLEAGLLAHEVTLERDRLEVGMGEDHRQRARTLVRFATLDADPPVLHHVDAAPAVLSDRGAEREHQFVQRHGHLVESHRDPAVEAHDELPWVARRVGQVAGERVRVGWRRDPGVFEDPALDGATPQVLVDGVRALLVDVDGDGNVVLDRVVDAVRTGEAPDPHRCEHFEVGGERAHRYLETHLIVALAGAAVRDGVGAELTRREHQVACNHRPRQRRDERVLAFVQRVGAD